MYIEHDQLQADTCVYERSRSGWVRRRLDLGLRLRLVDLDNSGARESAPYIGRPAADGVLAVGILHSGFMPATTTPRTSTSCWTASIPATQRRSLASYFPPPSLATSR